METAPHPASVDRPERLRLLKGGSTSPGQKTKVTMWSLGNTTYLVFWDRQRPTVGWATFLYRLLFG